MKSGATSGPQQVLRDAISRGFVEVCVLRGLNRKLRCQVCNHDQRWRAELLRAGGASLDSLAAKFRLHRDAIDRHYTNHVAPELKQTYLAGPVQLQELADRAGEVGGSVLDHLHAVRVILMGHLASMTEAG